MPDDRSIVDEVLDVLDEAHADVPSDDYITLDELRAYVGRALNEYHRRLMDQLSGAGLTPR